MPPDFYNTPASTTLTGGYTGYTDTVWPLSNSVIYVGNCYYDEPAVRLPPPHRVATDAAARDRAPRRVRRMMDKVKRSLALERQTWVAAPRRVTR